MPRGSTSRGRGSRGRRGRRETDGKQDSANTRYLMEHLQGEGSDVSSLADVTPLTLSNVKLTTESTVMKVSLSARAVNRVHHD